MSKLEFDRSSHGVQLFDHAGVALTPRFDAYNFVDSHSRGPWPDGTYAYAGYNAHAEVADPESEYGSYGILYFSVPARIGMGVHSGRRNIPDGLGRYGPEHCTLGCIRTTDEAMAVFVEAVRRDPLESIGVVTLAASAEFAVRKTAARIGKARRRSP